MRFNLVDVFAESAYSGNPLAVFFCERALPAEMMQRIANEIHFSESVFVLSSQEEDEGWPVRIFTPLHEVAFAGHPSLGAAYIISRTLFDRPVSTVKLRAKAGLIPVYLSPERNGPLWMDQIPPLFGETLPASELAPVLGLPVEAIDGRYPVQEVSTGLPHILVPLVSLEALKEAKIDRERYFRLVEKTWAKPILVFSLQGRDSTHQVSVRMFADYLGVPEDPATGSGNGCLAGYLVKHRVLGAQEVSLVSGQGHEIGRPSHLFLEGRDQEGGALSVRVGGRVVDTASGEWSL